MDRLIRITTATAVATVAAVAAVISYRHAYELVSTHGEIGLTARLVPFTRRQPDPGSKHAHPRCQPAQAPGTTPGTLVPRRRHHRHHRRQPGTRPRPWPDRCPGQRLASPGARRLLRATHDPHQDRPPSRNQARSDHPGEPATADREPRCTTPLTTAPNLEQTVQARHEAGHSQRAIARELNLDRRKIKRILDQAA